MTYYPVFLNINNKKCVVFGGGEVALRKVKTLLEHGAEVKVVSPVTCPELIILSENKPVQIINRNYQEGDLEKAFLTIAATDEKETNLKIATEARQRGCLINTVDDAENSDYIVPSVLRRGDITVAVSTAGKSPALARRIRTELEEKLGEEYTLLVQLAAEVRSEMKRKNMRINGESWQKALELETLIPLLKQGKEKEAKSFITQNLMKQVK